MSDRSTIRVSHGILPVLPAAARLRLFRDARLIAAGLAACLLPILAVSGGMPVAATAAILLAGFLPAVIAAEVGRPAQLPRAASLSLLIMGVVLTAGALRGLPFAGSLVLLAVAAVEAGIVAGRRGHRAVCASAMAGLAGIAAAGCLGPGTVAPPAAHLALAALALCGGSVILRHIAAQLGSRANGMRAAGALQPDFDAVMRETLLEIDASGGVRRVGGNARSLLGLAPEALEGRGLFDLTLVADRPALLTAISGSLTAQAPQSLRFRLRSESDGPLPQFRWVALDAAASGRPGLAVASLRDVSADVIEEDRLAVAAGETASALKARSAFLTTVNHELRTPLNAIVGFSDILANPMTTPKDQRQVRDYARIVNEAGLDLLRMVSAMIDITRIDSGIYGFEAEDQELNDLVESAVEAFRREPESKGRAITVKAEGAFRARVDARALRSALDELLSNAVKFGRGKAVEVILGCDSQGVALTVRDQGDGIAADKLALLGRHFSRLDEGLGRETGGIGLGLSLVRGLMALHGGDVRFESVSGKGTSVVLRLPSAAAAAAPANVLKLTDARKRNTGAAPAPDKERRRA